MHHAIRHDSTSRTLLAYLATHEGPVKSAHIVRYMELMHNMEAGSVRAALCYHVKAGSLHSVVRGYYAARWEFVS